jgi:hypothetical protein
MSLGRRLLLTTIVGALALGMLSALAAGATRTAGAGPSVSQACKPAVIGGKHKCLKVGQACAARYQAAYKKYGFVCTGGHLRKRTAPPPPPPSPPPPPPSAPPPPPATPGHYSGRTSQNEIFEFDVNAAGTRLAGLKTGQINQSCTPGAYLYGGRWNLGSSGVSINADGSFKIEFDFNGTVGTDPSTGHFAVDGHFNGATAQGTFTERTNFTHDGVSYSCSSGQQTWTASKTG